jgi:hypothetical protein
MSFPRNRDLRWIEENAELIVHGTLQFVYEDLFPGLMPRALAKHWMFSSKPTVENVCPAKAIRNVNIEESILLRYPDLGFWTLPGDPVPPLGQLVRVALSRFRNNEGYIAYYPLAIWDNSGGQLVEIQKTVEVSAGCNQNSNRVDSPIAIGIRVNTLPEAEILEAVLQWSEHFNMQLRYLTPPNYNQPHDYELFWVESIPGDPLARTFFPGSTRNPTRIMLNKRYQWTTLPFETGKYHFQSVVTHELGHALCLNHICDSEEAVMYPTFSPITPGRPEHEYIRTVLTDRDIELCRQYYP